jgi:hypothetical protein
MVSCQEEADIAVSAPAHNALLAPFGEFVLIEMGHNI